MSLPTRVRVVILGIFMSIIFVLNECKKLDGYKFPVFSTPYCPRNESEWNKRSSALNCNKTNGYTCFPNEKLTELLEFCYIEPWILIEEGYCLYLERKGSYVDSYSCRHFLHGCHNTSYISKIIFEYPACISIGNGCFLAEKSCKSSPKSTHRPKTTENNKDDWFWVVVVIGIVVVFVCVSTYMLYFYLKKRKDTDIERKGELEEGKSLITNTKNENLDYSYKGTANKKYCSYEDALRTTDGNEGPFVIGSFTPAVYSLEAGSYVCLLHMDEPDTKKRFALVIRSQTPLCNIELHHME